jgi:hypothetical protein
MSFNDRAADGEANAHAAFLDREETLKKAAQLVFRYAGASVLNQGGDGVPVCERGSNEQAAFFLACHRLQPVDREICEDLLKLDAVAPYMRKNRRQIQRRLHGLPLELRREKHHDFLDDLIQCERNQLWLSV